MHSYTQLNFLCKTNPLIKKEKTKIKGFVSDHLN